MMKEWLRKKRKALLLPLALIVLAAGTAAAVFGYLGKHQLAGPVEAEPAYPESSLTGLWAEPDAEAPLPKRQTYPVGKWEMEIPYLNPFGSQDNYRSVEYTANQSQEFRYVDKSNAEAVRMTAGDSWQMRVDWDDPELNPFDDLILYMMEMGGEYYRGAKEDQWVVHAKDDEGNSWWGMTSGDGKGYKLTVYKERRLRAGETVTFKTGDFKNNEIYVMTENTTLKYQSLRIELPEGEVQVSGKSSFEQGRYSRNLSYTKTVSAHKSNRYTLNDIPQDTSSPVQWTLRWNKNGNPGEIAVTLDEGEPLDEIADGEALGALKVRWDVPGRIKVEMPDGISINHPELHVLGDKTPEGDTLFWLPSGYWNITVTPDKSTSVAQTLNTRLIPVHSGEMTIVDIEPLVSRSYSSSEVGEAGGEGYQLTITDIQNKGEQAEVLFTLLDSQNRHFTPSLANTEIREGGKPGKLIGLERVQIPPSIVLALDSSGSMAGSMDAVLDSARAFIGALPDDVHIQVIDFDTEIRLLDGATKQDVLDSLTQVKALGATTLYDSILQGLELLRDQERPTLVVFTDGVDSNTEGGSSGSKASQQEVERAVGAAGIPLFTIGFGPGHDAELMLGLASLSGGAYYSAEDAEALNHVFASIQDRLGNHYTAVYERPEEAGASDTPVISLTLDVSGSMDVDPASGNGAYRLDKVKTIFHPFIQQTPEHSLLQLLSFSSEVTVDQVFTRRRAEVIQALGGLRAQGATNIFRSIELTYKSLQHIPSNKKVMVYVTDAALDVPEAQKASFEKLLAGIKADGIAVLWVGLGMEEAEEAFRWAAEKSGGQYIITEDAGLLSKALEDVLASAQQKPAEHVTLSMSIRDDSEAGNARDYTASKLSDFPARKSSSDTVQLNTIAYQTGIKLAQYETAVASLISGSDIPSEDVQIYKRMPFNMTSKNQAMELSAHEMYYLKRLKGVDAPRGKSFLAVELSLQNKHPEGVPYLIPDFASHFFVEMNRNGAYPASTATWLTEAPLAPPGETGVMIRPDETLRGALLFLVPDEVTEQAAVRFYDTTNGHITLALLGTPQMEDVRLASLPTGLTGKLSDTFSITPTASSDLEKIEEVELKDKKNVFKVLEADMTSQVQALLKLDPEKRFSLRMHTAAGPVMVPPHTATALLPHGFLRPVAMGPGSSNKVRFAFQIPKALAQQPLELVADLRGGSMVLPVGGREGGTDAAAFGAEGSAQQLHQGEGVALQINALARASLSGRSNTDYIVADITLTDHADGSGTSGFMSSFTLTTEGEQSQQQAQTVKPDSLTDELLLGIDSDWAVFDGQSRRGLLVFAVPSASKEKEEKWVLRSSLFDTLQQPMAEAPYSEPDLLVKKENLKLDEKFNTELSVALSAIISKHNAKKTAANALRADLEELEASPVPAPLPLVHGLQKLDNVQTEEDFRSLLASLKWLPSSDKDWNVYRYSPEAVITQGWGTEADLAHLTGSLLAKLGYKPSLRQVNVTNKGREALKEIGAVDEVKASKLPAWVYRDREGAGKILVIPFMKDLSELSGLVFLPGGQPIHTLTSEQAKISVYYQVESLETKGVNSIAGAISNALGGGGGSSEPAVQDVRMLETELPLAQLSNEPLDLRVGGENGLYKAVLENQSLQIIGSHAFDPGKGRVTGVRIEVQLRSGKQVHETVFREGDEIFGVFHTLAINLPDMTAEATNTLQQIADQKYSAAAKPDDQSALVWYTRNILYRFVSNQTAYEKRLADELQVTAGRTGKERVLVVTVRRQGEQTSLHTSINLMQSVNELHRSNEEAARAFHMMSGLYASRLEGEVLPGNKADFMEVWSRSPDDAALWLSLPYNRKNDLKAMEELGMPELLVKRAKDSPKALLMPTKSTRIYGENRWAWLEIDPKTYETIAVMDTGEHGGFAEYVMNLQPVSPTGEDYQAFMAGSFLGVATSVWSVSSFSLILDDYEEIIEAARAYTMGLGEVLSGMMDQKDLPKLEYNMSPVKVKLDNADFDYLAKYFEEVQMGKEVKLSQDVVGFTLGFKAGAAYYFKRAAE